MKYKLIIIWDNGNREEYIYGTQERAEKTAHSMKVVFGDQIEWLGIVEQKI